MESDTTINFTLNKNEYYSYKMTVHGTTADPHIAARPTGVYTTLPGQAPVRHSDIAIPWQAGTYAVGKDIPAGQYAHTGDGSRLG